MARLSEIEVGQLVEALLEDGGDGAGERAGERRSCAWLRRRWRVAPVATGVGVLAALTFLTFAEISAHEGASSGSPVAMQTLKHPAVSALALSIVTAPVVAQTAAVQWRVEDGGNGHWYELRELPQRPTCVQARAMSIADGGFLVALETLQELIFFRDLRCSVGKQHLSAWQALARVGSAWTWDSGAPFQFQSWSPAQPDGGDTATIDWAGPSGQCDTITWGDESCLQGNLPAALFIEWSADCNSDGIVDYGQILTGALDDTNANNVPDCCESGPPCPIQWRAEDGGNGHWYALVIREGRSWTELQSLCADRGGHLATLTNAPENAFAVANAMQGERCLIGGLQEAAGTEPGGSWGWITGERMEWTNWENGEPNNYPHPGDEDVMGCWGNGMWVDTEQPPSLWTCGFGLVEWSSDCNADGIVDYGQILVGQLVDANANGVPDICEVDPCPGDITGGGTVDSIDISVILGAWGTAGQGEFDADVDDNGTVDALDLGVVLSGWGSCP